MGIEFSCAMGDCEFLHSGEDREQVTTRAREHVETEHQVPADEYDIEEDISRTE
ncbi:hypothetical protein ACFQDG_03495 [Natronoarchaeum mannanilyticum]|uniref:DUF1059 domain-containing protein n=1 Tax=Natronoarchaeum mannanilyticum TaxID=926360 RepID=A0AAV3T7C9_9EURY